MRKPNIVCSICCKRIYRRPGELEKNKQKAYCSTNCYGRSCRKIRTCLVCKKEYFSSFTKKTCSRACSNKHRTGIKYKLNRPRDKVVYMDGLKLRLMIERGKNCQRCGFSKTEILIIHHIDRDRTHNEPSNLELICPNCHAEEHYLEKSWLRRYNMSEYKEKLELKEPLLNIYLTEGCRSPVYRARLENE